MMKKDDKKAKDAQPSEQQEQEPHEHHRMRSILHLPSEFDEWSKASWCGGVTYIVIGAVAIILACADVAVTAIATSTERSLEQASTGRLVTMIILIVAAIACIAMVIYAICGVCHKHTKPLHTTAIALVILVIIQAIICGVSVHISQKEQLVIERNIASSFTRAKDGDPSQVKIWDHISSGLECCGLYGPEDFRLDPFGPLQLPPDVPDSCCPYYRNRETNATDERERALCKLTRSYYKTGCKEHVVAIIKGLSTSVVTVSSVLMALEVVLAILGGILSRKRKHEKHDQIEVVISTKQSNDTEAAK